MMIEHPLKPIYNEASRVLILGTMPSPKSREEGIYYGHPRNRFWKVMAYLFDEWTPLTVQERTEFALRYHFALWDVLKSCDIKGASDASIKEPVANDISIILDAAPISAIFCTGTKAHSLYVKHIEPAVRRPAFRLPSTSPANCAVPFFQLCEDYMEIKRYLL